MSPWVRLFEKITGTPHRLDDSLRVQLAAEKLKVSTDQLSERLKRYLDSPDPLAAMAAYLMGR